MIYHMKVLRSDGSEEELRQDTRPDLRQLQDIVNGIIEVVQLSLIVDFDAKKKIHVKPQMIVNEEGLLLGLVLNKKATQLYQQTARNNGVPTIHPIVGDVVVLENFRLT